ncbi:uncharacterized protein A4U43_C06F12680, partial [Asparagus officinalis]
EQFMCFEAVLSEWKCCNPNHIWTTTAPLRPSTTINRQAATRFIEHSLPDLTPGQRHSMREISRQEDTRNRFNNKRKHSPSEKQSVRDAAQEFLEKAARELLGSNDLYVLLK